MKREIRVATEEILKRRLAAVGVYVADDDEEEDEYQ